MAIKSEEKNENAVVSKKMPSFVIRKKQNVSKKATSINGTSIANVSSKRIKRTVVRKNKKISNTNLETPEIPETKEVQEVEEVQEFANKNQNTLLSNEDTVILNQNIQNSQISDAEVENILDEEDEKTEVTISLDNITKRLADAENVGKEIKSKININSKTTNKTVTENIVDNYNENIIAVSGNVQSKIQDEPEKELQNEVPNIVKEPEEEKTHTVITPNYTVHKSRISRRSLSFNLNKNLDDLVVTAPKQKEVDVSINQNSAFFYEPSVFQKFNIDVIDADSDETESNVENDSIVVDNVENTTEDNTTNNIDDNVENKNPDTIDTENSETEISENIEVKAENESDNILLDTVESQNIPNENITEAEEINDDEDIDLSKEFDEILTELIQKEIIQEQETEEKSDETLDSDNLISEVNNENQNIENEETSAKEIDEASEIKQENVEDFEENNIESSDDIIDNTSDDDSSTIKLFDDIDISSNSDNDEIIDEILEDLKQDNEKQLQEAADNIIDSKDVKVSESNPFFNSSIPGMTTEVNSKETAVNKVNRVKKQNFSGFSNIFKKFTFDEANFKNIISNNINTIPISNITNDSTVTKQTTLENLENQKKSIKEFEVSASPASLVIPTIDTDEAQITSDTSIDKNSADIDFYNIITPASLDTKPNYDDFDEENNNQDDSKEINIFNLLDKHKEENENTSEKSVDIDSKNDSDSEIDENIDDIDINDISIDDLDLIDNIELDDVNNTETLASKINEDEIDENFVNENPIQEDTYFEKSNEQDSYIEDTSTTIEETDDIIEAENYDFEDKKMSNYFSEDDEFSIEDYFGLNNIKDEVDSNETEQDEELDEDNTLIEDDNDAIEFDNPDEEKSEEDNSKTDMSAFSKLIENFTQTISTLSDRIADLEEDKNAKRKSKKSKDDIDIKENEIDNDSENENNQPISPTEVLESSNEIEDIENADIIDVNNANIFDEISIDDISLDDIDDISLEDIENIENNNQTENTNSKDDKKDSTEEETVEFGLPLNDNGIMDEPNLFDSISADDISLDDISLEDIEEFEEKESENKKLEDTKTAKDILTKTFSAENPNINEQMKSELLSELESNPDIDKALLEPSNDDPSDNAVTSDLYKIIDTLAETITQLENSPDMEDNPKQLNTNEILNLPTEITGEGKAINILINKDDIFSISILNETYEIIADFDGISVLSENIHISTPKKNFFVKIGDKYIEIHNNKDSFQVYTNFEDIEFANAINNVAFAKKNNKIELNIKEAFKISSANNIVELSMLNTSVANIVNANSNNTDNVDETSICDNRTLLISEETQKVYLPYTIDEVMKKLHDSNEYQTVEEVIENEYTVPLSTFKMPIISRFKEAYRFMRVKEKSSVYAALDLALELMFTSNLNPAVIRAAKDLKELNIYLDCLYENEVDKFDCFKIIYKVLPKIK